MENLKEKMTEVVKKIGAIKTSPPDYKYTKYSDEDVIDMAIEVAEESANEFAIKFSEWLPTTKWSKVLDVNNESSDCYLHTIKRIKCNSKQLVELFRKENC